MGALLAFQPRGDPAPEPFLRARAWIEEGKGLPVEGEAGGACRVVKYGRLRAGASPPATSDRGWLAAAGTWDHPATDGDADTAGLLRLVEQRGDGVLDELDGMYAVLWHDAREGSLTVATDLCGRLHTFVAETSGGVYVSTSAIALAAAVPGGPDASAVYEMLAGGTLYEDRTPFLRVRRLLGGRRYRFERGRAVAATPQRMLPVGRPGASLDDRVGALVAAADAGLQRFLRPYARPLPDLTGGVDSRLVVGLLQRRRPRFDVTVTGDERAPDVVGAARLAGALGLPLLREPPSLMADAQASLDRVLAAAALAEGGFNAVEYAGIAAIHKKHGGTHDATINGSGGEVFRNYWWNAAQRNRNDLDPVPVATRRFAGTAAEPTLLAREHRPGLVQHYGECVANSLAARRGDPFHALLDHAYLDLRMQCWQGSIASATNQIWPTLSPLMWEAPLRLLFAADPAYRLDGRLIFAMLRSFGAPYTTSPLTTGFPPQPASWRNAWRFVPGLARAPVQFAGRVRRKLLPREDPHARAVARRLGKDAADYLAPESMQLLPLLDRAAFDAFRDGLAAGAASFATLGRVLALEHALRAAN